jgi:hypothetical protein
MAQALHIFSPQNYHLKRGLSNGRRDHRPGVAEARAWEQKVPPCLLEGMEALHMQSTSAWGSNAAQCFCFLVIITSKEVFISNGQ